MVFNINTCLLLDIISRPLLGLALVLGSKHLLAEGSLLGTIVKLNVSQVGCGLFQLQWKSAITHVLQIYNQCIGHYRLIIYTTGMTGL